MNVARRMTVLIVLLATASAVGQGSAAAPKYDNPAEIAALQSLVPSETQPGPSPLELVELSRLLSSPCDQMRWLLERLPAAMKQPATPEGAEQPPAGIERGENLSKDGFLEGCAELLEPLRKLILAPKSLADEADPAKLSALAREGKDRTDEKPWVKFVLLARGFPESQLPKKGAQEDWDWPRQAVKILARDPVLPKFDELRNWTKKLSDAYDDLAKKPAFSDPNQQQAVEASFQIAAALFDRALGLDPNDRAPGLDPNDVAKLKGRIEYPTNATRWSRLAGELAAERLPAWEVLARLLADADSPGGAADVQDVRKTWEDVRAVDPNQWPAVDDPNRGWLARLAPDGQRNAAGMLPLSSDFRSAARKKRGQYEVKVADLVNKASLDTGDAVAANKVFQAIQNAKAAELGVSPDLVPLTIDDVKCLFGGDKTNEVYLFVEVLNFREMTPPPPPGDVVCGVAIFRKNDIERNTENAARYKTLDWYEVKILGPTADAEQLVGAALKLVPKKPTPKTDARILIAPDGLLPAQWPAFEQKELLQLAKKDIHWIVYLPCALALKEHWTLDETLRVWYRTSVRAGSAALDLEPGSQTLGISPLTKSGDSCAETLSGMVIKCLWERESKDSNTTVNDLPGFMAMKPTKTAPGYPLWVRQK